MRRWFSLVFVNYKKGCTRLAAASNKVYQLLAHGRWFSPASSTTKTGRHDIAEILLKVVLKHFKSNQSNEPPHTHTRKNHRNITDSFIDLCNVDFVQYIIILFIV
jgi:hypothetical protein